MYATIKVCQSLSNTVNNNTDIKENHIMRLCQEWLIICSGNYYTIKYAFKLLPKANF